jgi:hypothetical protein
MPLQRVGVSVSQLTRRLSHLGREPFLIFWTCVLISIKPIQLHAKFALVPADKAANNIIIV